MIALPFGDRPAGAAPYRLLMNQYRETLTVTTADRGVPNRGFGPRLDPANGDQTLIALDYEQKINQVSIADFPPSGLTPAIDKPIHHEPGLFLNMLNQVTDDLVVARLGTIPHGDLVLALGQVSICAGAPDIPFFSGLPIGLGAADDLLSDADPANRTYMDPYKHFHFNPFKGKLADVEEFAGFEPVDPLDLLRAAQRDLKIKKTTTLDFDTALETGGIINIPFVTRQANATRMRSIFWFYELDEQDPEGEPALALQYAQIVMLEFFARRDGIPGLIKWPHVSINTMKRVMKEPISQSEMINKGMNVMQPVAI